MGRTASLTHSSFSIVHPAQGSTQQTTTENNLNPLLGYSILVCSVAAAGRWSSDAAGLDVLSDGQGSAGQKLWCVGGIYYAVLQSSSSPLTFPIKLPRIGCKERKETLMERHPE